MLTMFLSGVAISFMACIAIDLSNDNLILRNKIKELEKKENEENKHNE